MPEHSALVTGASRGIGRAIALSLARTGVPVAVNYQSNEAAAKETLNSIEEAGGRGFVIQGDVSIRADVDRIFDEAEKELGRVGVLVNNAGIRADALSIGMSDDDWHKVINTNLYGTFACARRALKSMLRLKWGRIVNIASVSGMRGTAGQANYTAAKAGVIGLTRTLAVEVANRGITVNAVAPGLISTDIIEGLSESAYASIISRLPMGVPGNPEDVAEVVAFLCSEEARYVTGALLPVDGGGTAF